MTQHHPHAGSCFPVSSCLSEEKERSGGSCDGDRGSHCAAYLDERDLFEGALRKTFTVVVVDASRGLGCTRLDCLDAQSHGSLVSLRVLLVVTSLEALAGSPRLGLHELVLCAKI